MEQFDFYKELYFKENERRQEVLNSLNIPIAIHTALSSASYFFVSSFDYNLSITFSIIFIALISVIIILLLFSIYFLIRAFSNFSKGYEYSGLPYAKELYDWNISLEKHYEKYGSDRNLAKEHFSKFLIENLVKHTEDNMYVNDKKNTDIFINQKNILFFH